MTLWNLIPTCGDPMSQYTVVAISMVVAVGIVTFGAVVWWNMREFKRIDDCIGKYDAYIDETGKVISTMATDIAVLRSAVQNIEKDGSETKDAIKEINKTLMDRLTRK